MLWLYDEAICKDLQNSFQAGVDSQPVVRVIDPDHVMELIAQMKEDTITFPVVAVTRDPDWKVDTERTNFTRQHIGIASVIDPETNMLYYEKSIPIELGYHITIFATNTADMDELVKELLFKYLSMYFLTITLPYESGRKARFGVTCLADQISRESSTANYLSEGKLYRTVIPLVTQGCCLLSYTPQALKRLETEIESE